jgi:segregation and condensation protein B
MPPSNLRSAVEALLFSSDQPVTLALMADALEAPAEEITAALTSLTDEYASREAGVSVREMSGGWIVTTTPEQHEWVARMLRGKRKMRLSRPALETMAIVAYKQPVTKSEIEAIRGVDASGVLATLLERNLVTIKGRSTLVGRPLLYGTTGEFLNYFGLRDLTELPRPEELRALVAAREPEQLEMMELDPESGMPLALAQTSAPAETEVDVVAALVAAASDTAQVRDDADTFSIADADAAIAQANAARAEAAMAFVEEVPLATAQAGASDLAESSDAGPADEEDAEDEFEDEDEDDEFDDAYEDDDEDEDDEEDAEDEEDSERPTAVLDEGGRH